MACVQLLKSSPSNSMEKSGCLCSKFNSRGLLKRNLRLPNSRIVVYGNRRVRVSCKAEDGDNQSKSEEPPESLFMKELRRRGMTPGSMLEEKTKNSDREDVKYREEDGGWSNSRRNGVTTDVETNLSNQREKSMALNSEGLEGLIPRAKLLLTLGGTFFLAFWPLTLVTVALFSCLYLYFGPEFVHDGSDASISPPPYVDPYALLEEERIYKTAPLLE